jgi:hypothetical protein
MAVVAVLLGMGTGFLAALAGVGGGFLYVPILILIFGLDPQDAVGTSLAVIIFTTLAASASYLRQNKVFFRSAACILPPSIIGAVAGAYLTDFISGTLITVLFSLFVGLLAIKLIFPDFPLVRAFRKGPSFIETSPDTNSFIVETNVYYVHYGIWGFLAGLASGLTGIGGGIFNVPALVTTGMPVHYAVATSSLAVLGTSSAGAFTHATLGHIQTAYALTLSIGAIVGAYAGAHTAPKIPGHLLRSGIGSLLAMVAFGMLVSIFIGL